MSMLSLWVKCEYVRWWIENKWNAWARIQRYMTTVRHVMLAQCFLHFAVANNHRKYAHELMNTKTVLAPLYRFPYIAHTTICGDFSCIVALCCWSLELIQRQTVSTKFDLFFRNANKVLSKIAVHLHNQSKYLHIQHCVCVCVCAVDKCNGFSLLCDFSIFNFQIWTNAVDALLCLPLFSFPLMCTNYINNCQN